MKPIRIPLLFAALAVAPPALFAEEGKPSALVGTYTVVRGERDGKKLDPEEFKGSVVTFTEGKIYGTDKDKKEFFGATYTLDTSRKPWVIRMTSTAPKKGEKAEGVVEVSGDTLRICYALPGGEAPAGFKAGEKQHCFELKRVRKPR